MLVVMESFDVVVVGGGIAGSSLAYALAREGLAVAVLEASVEYEDRVRGETMVPWGVDEARAASGSSRSSLTPAPTWHRPGRDTTKPHRRAWTSR